MHLQRPTNSKTDRRRWENVQSKTPVRWCTWQAHLRQMFLGVPWGVRKINDQSHFMFESPSVINLPATSGRYIDSEHLCTLIKLKGIVVTGQQAACKDASPIQSKMPSCALAVWLSFRMKVKTTKRSGQDHLWGYLQEDCRVIYALCYWLSTEANKKRMTCQR